MYCIKCGVKLADTEKNCPLCKTKVYHPDIPQQAGEAFYPEGVYPKEQGGRFWIPVALSVMFLLPILIVLLCDLQFSGKVTWSGYVMGALLMSYVILVLPTWFRKPNPVIFVPCSFLAIGLYVLYVNIVTGGTWFMSFAFPVIGVATVLVTTVVTLSRYIKGGRLYLYGGAGIVLGCLMILMEYLMSITFTNVRFIGWSLYPFVTLFLLGGFLIFLGICRPVREAMERKFFL